LVWMGTKEFMLEQIKQKITDGFSTIKIKVGAIEVAHEIEILKYLRQNFKTEKIEIRLDANGAFNEKNALEILKKLSEYDIHSIEQPIAKGQHAQMAEICSKSPIPIVLDEELIGLDPEKDVLSFIKPQYIILKPTLIGTNTKTWIDLAEKSNIKWWITSALESNIGLNAICQFTANYENSLPQGLGTGSLYTNNIDSPLEVKNGNISLNKNLKWDLSHIS
jgi:L-alanine-DL-glutamate epimerase-like enolase superfamily enzyme